MRIEPAPSLPCATGTQPAATSAAEPPLDPPAPRSGIPGVARDAVAPGLGREADDHLGDVRDPSVASPAARNRRMISRSHGATAPSKRSLPMVKGTPSATGPEFLMRKGTPANGPSAAWSSGASNSGIASAFSVPSTAPIASRAAASTSASLTSPARSRSRSPTASWAAYSSTRMVRILPIGADVARAERRGERAVGGADADEGRPRRVDAVRARERDRARAAAGGTSSSAVRRRACTRAPRPGRRPRPRARRPRRRAHRRRRPGASRRPGAARSAGRTGAPSPASSAAAATNTPGRAAPAAAPARTARARRRAKPSSSAGGSSSRERAHLRRRREQARLAAREVAQLLGARGASRRGRAAARRG